MKRFLALVMATAALAATSVAHAARPLPEPIRIVASFPRGAAPTASPACWPTIWARP